MRNWHSILFLSYIIPKFLRNYVYDLISKKRKSLMKDRCVIDELKKERKVYLIILNTFQSIIHISYSRGTFCK